MGGSAARLKADYGSEYLLEAMIAKPMNAPGSLEARDGAEDMVAALSQFVRDRLSAEAELLEKQPERCLFRVPAMGPHAERDLTVGKAFLELGQWKDKLCLASYNISQPTLEQVFLRLAQEQEA